MGAKISFINIDLNEKIYIEQIKLFVKNDKKISACKLRKFIYDLK